MHPHMIKLLSLSGLTLGLLAASQGVRADEIKAPTFSAEPCCSLCPAAHDAKNYTTRYQQNFTTLVQAQGDWLFRTQEDLRTEFNTTPAGYKRWAEYGKSLKGEFTLFKLPSAYHSSMVRDFPGMPQATLASSAQAATASMSARSGRQNHPSQTMTGMAPSKMPFS